VEGRDVRWKRKRGCRRQVSGPEIEIEIEIKIDIRWSESSNCAWPSRRGQISGLLASDCRSLFRSRKMMYETDPGRKKIRSSPGGLVRPPLLNLQITQVHPDPAASGFGLIAQVGQIDAAMAHCV
jgi:hypothetical protein